MPLTKSTEILGFFIVLILKSIVSSLEIGLGIEICPILSSFDMSK